MKPVAATDYTTQVCFQKVIPKTRRAH